MGEMISLAHATTSILLTGLGRAHQLCAKRCSPQHSYRLRPPAIHSHKTRHGGRGRPVPLSQTDCDRPVGTSAERSKRTLKRVEYKSASTAGHHRQASVDARSTQDPRSDRSPGQLSALSLGQMDVAFGGFQPCKDDAVNGRCAQIAVVPHGVANATDIPMRWPDRRRVWGRCRERTCFLGTPCGRARRRANSCPGCSPRSGANCGARRSSRKRRA